jgi:hypothetical protein
LHFAFELRDSFAQLLVLLVGRRRRPGGTPRRTVVLPAPAKIKLTAALTLPPNVSKPAPELVQVWAELRTMAELMV